MLSRLFARKTDAKKILVVDDEPDMVMVLGKFLEHNGFEVITAADGDECIAKAKGENSALALILLDNVMPNMNGQTALVKLKSSKETRDIPVIMVTAISDEDDIAAAQRCGAAEYVVKPFDYAVLLEKIKHILKSRLNI